VSSLAHPDDNCLAEALPRYDQVLVDVGCGDGKYTLRLAIRHPASLVIGVDAEIARLGRTLRVAGKRKISNLLFLRWALENPLPVLGERADEMHVIMPWGSLLDGVLGAAPIVLANLLSLGRRNAQLRTVINCRPWDAPAALDKQLASTPEPSPELLANLRQQYADSGWVMQAPRWLTDQQAHQLGSSWISRVVSTRASRLLLLPATRRA